MDFFVPYRDYDFLMLINRGSEFGLFLTVHAVYLSLTFNLTRLTLFNHILKSFELFLLLCTAALFLSLQEILDVAG